MLRGGVGSEGSEEGRFNFSVFCEIRARNVCAQFTHLLVLEILASAKVARDRMKYRKSKSDCEMKSNK